MENVLRDFPDHADTIAKALPGNSLLGEACGDYERLSERLRRNLADEHEAKHIREILAEMRAEILRLASQARSES